LSEVIIGVQGEGTGLLVRRKQGQRAPEAMLRSMMENGVTRDE
jgi:hypothetical protein